MHRKLGGASPYSTHKTEGDTRATQPLLREADLIMTHRTEERKYRYFLARTGDYGIPPSWHDTSNNRLSVILSPATMER